MFNFFKSKIFLSISFIITIGLLWGMSKSLVYKDKAFDVDGALKQEVSKEGYFDTKILNPTSSYKH
jgi:hypothetical protein